MLSRMTRWAPAAVVALAACGALPLDEAKPERGYAGTVQKVFRIVRQGADLPGIRYLGRVGAVLGPALRRNAETHQYVVRTPQGHIVAQSDEEYRVGECVRVIPEAASSGPAFRYGEAAVVPCR